MFKNFGYKKGRLETSNKRSSFWVNAQTVTKNGKIGVSTEKVAKAYKINSEVIKKYKGKPVWLALDINNKPVTYEGCIASNIDCNYANAHAFIMAQLIKVDSISKFAVLIGADVHGVEFLRLLTKNDRNLQFWENLAIKWFSAKWMGEQDDQ